MLRVRKLIHQLLPVLQVMLIVIWLCNLAATDSYFSVYALIAFFSFYLSFMRSDTREFSRLSLCICLVLSTLFSSAVLLSNYPLFTTVGDPAVIGHSTSIAVNLINSLLSFAGGIFVCYPIIRFTFLYFPINVRKQVSKGVHPALIFASIVLINLIHFFLVEYPGNTTEDTFTQIAEMVSGSYSNFNTFWHTMILQTVLSVGHFFFSDLNASIALFCVIQMILMAGAFTYCLMTLRKMRIPDTVIFVSYMLYLLMPYHMALSITIWKDVLFAGGTLLLLCALARILKIENECSVLDYLIFGLGSLLFLLSRTNGWLIYSVMFCIVLFPLRKYKKLLSMMACFAVLGWVLLNPVLSLLHIPDADRVESLSVPIQQVSRVIADGCELTDEDEVLLSQIVDIEEVPTLYTSWLSDPMKEEVRSHDMSYFEDNLESYKSLWIRLGLKYPWTYVKAWVDQTKGYWNGGYDYFLYAETITDNPYGVEKMVSGNPVASLFRLYFGLSRHVIFFEPLHSIGLHIWIVFLCFVLNLYRRREEAVLSVPLLLLVLGLCLGTPVYSCFRYVYPLFVSFPLIVATAVYKTE